MPGHQSELSPGTDVSPGRRSISQESTLGPWWLLAGAVLVGAVLGMLPAGMSGTPRDRALQMAAELVPPDASAHPVGEFDYPFLINIWYGGQWRASQNFDGGAETRQELSVAMQRQLEREGWEVASIEEWSAATIIRADQRDLRARVAARGAPTSDAAEGTIDIVYRSETPARDFVVGAVLGASIALAAVIAIRLGLMQRAVRLRRRPNT
jgi:hypothetical protein